MIERNNPYKSADKKSVRKVINGCKAVIASVAVGLTIFSFVAKKPTKEVIMEYINNRTSISYMMDNYKNADCESVDFEDKAFEEAYEDEDVTIFDLLAEEDLEISDPSSLNDLQYFPSLEVLELDDCDLEDLSSIAKLSQLKELELKNCPNVTDLSFLANSNIEVLEIYDITSLEDLSFLGEMSNLKSLTIFNCLSTNIDFEALRKLDLESLTIYFMSVDDLDFLSNMSGLKNLTINYANLTSLDGIEKLSELKEIDVSNCLLTDITPLYALHDLERIYITNNSIDSIDISKFPNLTKLSIDGNYALYTQGLLDYCKANDIDISINQEDVMYMNEVRSIISNLELDGLSEEEKLNKIYSYVLENLKYDYLGMVDNGRSNLYNDNPLYYALQGKGVCVNYAVLLDAMCDVAGIDAFEVSGEAGNLIKGPHAWNVVEIDGQYMLCDPTWSDSVRDSIDYKILHLFSDKNSDKYYMKYGEDAKKFVRKHRENVGLYGDDYGDIGTPFSDMIVGEDETEDSVEFISIDTNEDNKDEVSEMVAKGIASGAIIMGSAAVAVGIDSARMKKKRRERLRREEEEKRRAEQEEFLRTNRRRY